MKSILVFFFVVSCFTLTKAQEVQLKVNKPLSATDKAAVEKLLKDFDPNTYSFSANYIDAAGKTQKMASGSAKGLGSVTMANTKVVKPGSAASTVNTNNIFKASTVNTNNIFRASTVNTNNIFKASTVNTNNIFKPSDIQLNKMTQLHQILSKYQ